MKIGIIGAGQLGRMLALAGYPLGMRFVFVDKSRDAPGGQVGEIIEGNFDDPEALSQLADVCDVVFTALPRAVERITTLFHEAGFE